jgi:hypothetical protein
MQTKLPWFCAGLLGVIGWLIGYSMRGSSNPSAPPAAPLATKAGAASGDSGATPAADPETAAMVKDFETSAAQIMEDTNYLRQSYRLYLMVEGLGAADIPAALNAAMHLDSGKKFTLVAGLVSRWTELDPQAAAEYAGRFLKGREYLAVRASGLTAWAEKNFDAASQFALGLPPGEERDEALSNAAEALARTDPQRALKFLDENVKVSGNHERTRDYSTIVQEWAERDFEAAAKYSLAIRDHRLRRDALSMLAYSQSHKSPEDFLNWAKGISDAQSRDIVAHTALENWARNDPKATLTYARTLPAGAVQENAIGTAIAELAKSDLSEARRVIDQLPEGAARVRAIASLAQHLAPKNPATALEITDLLPEGSDQIGALHTIGMEWARTDPKAAADYFIHHPPKVNSNITSVIVSMWADGDPSEVLKWITALPEGKEKTRVLTSTLWQLAGNDPQAAAVIASGFTGESRSSALSVVASNWAMHDPAAASVWAATIGDETARRSAVENVARQWLKKDKTAASAWLQTTNLLTGEIRQRLLDSE